jgi:predicted MPP superfamily phosphohydrolase
MKPTDYRSPRPRSLFPLEFGSFRPLFVRREQLSWHLPSPLRILYASDLHLGHWWTRSVPFHLLYAAWDSRPDLILLGGDLVDNPGALAALQACIRKLTRLAPVYAVPGNHDDYVGTAVLRDAVLGAGGRWLLDQGIERHVRIDGVLTSTPAPGPRILCAHFPSIFPEAAAAGYRLVFAGHLHGGQCVLATCRERLYPAAWLHCWHGLRFREGDALMLVSRGAADTFPVRFNCPREVILCTIS